jgi:predicted metal-binding protein
MVAFTDAGPFGILGTKYVLMERKYQNLQLFVSHVLCAATCTKNLVIALNNRECVLFFLYRVVDPLICYSVL